MFTFSDFLKNSGKSFHKNGAQTLKARQPYDLVVKRVSCLSMTLNLKPGSHSHDFTGDHRRLESRGVVAGWSAARLSIVAGILVRGLLWSPGLS